MDLDERKRLIREKITMKEQSLWHGTGTRDQVATWYNQYHRDRDALRKIYIDRNIIPAIIEDWMDVLDGLEDEAIMNVRPGYHVDGSGNEFKDGTPYPSVVEARLARWHAKQMEPVERLARKFAKDVTYIIDGMLLGYQEKEIISTINEDTGYIKLCMSEAKKNKIRRHIELEKAKTGAPYEIARSIKKAGSDIRTGLESVADSIDRGFDKLSKSMIIGMAGVAESNLHVARSIDNVAKSHGAVAAAINELCKPVSSMAYMSRRYVHLKERIYAEAQEARLTPVLSGNLLFVNMYNGSTFEMQGNVYRRDGCYFISSLEGTMLLPESALAIYNAYESGISSFREKMKRFR